MDLGQWFESSPCKGWSLLLDAQDCKYECNMADGETLSLSRVGSVRLCMMAGSKERMVKLTDVYLATQLKRNIMSYGKLELKCFGFIYDGEARVLAKRINGEVALDLAMENNVLYVPTVGNSHVTGTPADVIMAIVADKNGVADSSSDMQQGTLTHFHQRLGHLSYDTVERMAKYPASGIQLTDRRRPTCLSCAEGKQTEKNQSQQDTGMNFSIDRIGGVICSDLKETMTPKDRHGNRYIVNFIDHKSNYCRVFLAPTKDRTAKQFGHFLCFFRNVLTAGSTCFERMVAVGTRTLTCSARVTVSRGKSQRRETKRRMGRLKGYIGPH